MKIKHIVESRIQRELEREAREHRATAKNQSTAEGWYLYTRYDWHDGRIDIDKLVGPLPTPDAAKKSGTNEYLDQIKRETDEDVRQGIVDQEAADSNYVFYKEMCDQFIRDNMPDYVDRDLQIYRTDDPDFYFVVTNNPQQAESQTKSLGGI